MIRIVKVEYAGGQSLRLTFSDGMVGLWDAGPLLASRDTTLTTPLREDPTEFARVFVESGALTWSNGLELAPWRLWEVLSKDGRLIREAKAA